MRAQINSSWDVAPAKTPPPGRRGEAIFNIQTLPDFFACLARLDASTCAAVRLSVVMILIVRSFFSGDGAVALGLRDSVDISSLIKSFRCLPLFLIFPLDGPVSSSSISPAFAFRRPWPLRLTYATSSNGWGRKTLRFLRSPHGFQGQRMISIEGYGCRERTAMFMSWCGSTMMVKPEVAKPESDLINRVRFFTI